MSYSRCSFHSLMCLSHTSKSKMYTGVCPPSVGSLTKPPSPLLGFARHLLQLALLGPQVGNAFCDLVVSAESVAFRRTQFLTHLLALSKEVVLVLLIR